MKEIVACHVPVAAIVTCVKTPVMSRRSEGSISVKGDLNMSLTITNASAAAFVPVSVRAAYGK